MATAAKARAHALLEQLGEIFVERVMLPIVRERLRAAGATSVAFARAVELTHDGGESPIAARLVAWFEWLAGTPTDEQERELYGLTAADLRDAEWEAVWLRDMRDLAATSPAVHALIVDTWPDTAAELGLLCQRASDQPPAVMSTQGGMPL